MGFLNQCHITLIAVGYLKNGPEFALYQHYRKRLDPKLFKLIEVKPTTKALEALSIQKHLSTRQLIIALDEKGENLTSREFSGLLEKSTIDFDGITFIIGGADGLDDTLKQQCHKLLSFGKATWPHLLVRTMIVEQIYRALSLLNNHPYHRD